MKLLIESLRYPTHLLKIKYLNKVGESVWIPSNLMFVDILHIWCLVASTCQLGIRHTIWSFNSCGHQKKTRCCCQPTFSYFGVIGGQKDQLSAGILLHSLDESDAYEKKRRHQAVRLPFRSNSCRRGHSY